MNNLYVIAIGGSGERILRSFTMALAAGVDINAKLVVPVIVDNDAKSAALTKCKDLIKAYRDPSKPGVHALYETIRPHLPSFCHVDIAEPITLDVSGGNIGDLKNVIGCPSTQGENDPYDEAIKTLNAERELLFTESELEMPLHDGFVGCPNIGSVVMNSMSLSHPNFQRVMNASSDDGVIVLGSLFGGTGAAGIPLIVNKLLNNGTTNKPLIGAVAMLPYFKIDESRKENDTPELKDKYDVQSDIFDVKTRAALMYYDKQMRDLNYMYYVGDDLQPVFDKSLGGPNQDNPACLCELMAAMAIVDFTHQVRRDNVKATYKRPVWGFQDDNNALSNTSGIINKELKRAIVKFKMMEQVFIHPEIMPKAIKDQRKTWDFVKDIHFDEPKLSSITTDGQLSFSDANGLNFLIKAFNQWLNELAKGNNRTSTLGRTLHIFDDHSTVEADQLAKAFFAEEDVPGMGLSQWEHHKPLFGNAYDEAVSADVLDALQEAYRELPEQFRRNIGGNQILPVVLLYISNALDKVLNKSFKI